MRTSKSMRWLSAHRTKVNGAEQHDSECDKAGIPVVKHRTEDKGQVLWSNLGDPQTDEQFEAFMRGNKAAVREICMAQIKIMQNHIVAGPIRKALAANRSKAEAFMMKSPEVLESLGGIAKIHEAFQSQRSGKNPTAYDDLLDTVLADWEVPDLAEVPE